MGGMGGSGMKEGDWMCASCGDHQFARNVACRKCGAARPDGAGCAGGGMGGGMAGGMGGGMGGMGGSGMKEGDWMCASCGDHQFARNVECRKCGAARPEGAGCTGGGMAGGKGGMGGGMGNMMQMMQTMMG